MLGAKGILTPDTYGLLRTLCFRNPGIIQIKYIRYPNILKYQNPSIIIHTPYTAAIQPPHQWSWFCHKMTGKIQCMKKSVSVSTLWIYFNLYLYQQYCVRQTNISAIYQRSSIKKNTALHVTINTEILHNL